MSDLRPVENLLYWAKFVCEEVSAQYTNSDEPPTWLAELEDAVRLTEEAGILSVPITKTFSHE